MIHNNGPTFYISSSSYWMLFVSTFLVLSFCPTDVQLKKVRANKTNMVLWTFCLWKCVPRPVTYILSSFSQPFSAWEFMYFNAIFLNWWSLSSSLILLLIPARCFFYRLTPLLVIWLHFALHIIMIILLNEFSKFSIYIIWIGWLFSNSARLSTTWSNRTWIGVWMMTY